MEKIQFGSKTIEYELSFCERKTLGITVTPELSVLVRAPLGASSQRIKEILRKRAPWIIRQQSFFLTFHPRKPERKYVSGETHFYLGRQYRLNVVSGETESVKLKGKFIEVTTTKPARVKTLMKEWYLKNATTKFQSIAIPLIEKFKRYKVEPSAIVLREMSLRWGSCTSKGKIILNPELVKAPRGCIEYVIIHELCHLVHRDHTRKFLELQTKEMPSWEKWKEKLERLLA